MVKVKEIYKQNIYGVITTLVFHIIVLIILLTSNLQYGKQSAEEAILVDFAKAEIKLPEPEKEKKQEIAATQQQISGSNQLASNRAVNDGSKDAGKSSPGSNDPFLIKHITKKLQKPNNW